MSTDRFTLWFAEVKGDVPTQIRPPKTYLEPAEAADAAENYLKYYGSSSSGSFVEIRFNGDKEPHTIIFLMDGADPPTFGIWNTPSAMWPIFYPESPYGIMLDGNPLAGDDDGDGKGKHKKDDDSDKMKLDGMDDGDDENEDDDDEESPEDENAEEDSDDESDDEGEEEEDEENSGDDENNESDSSDDPRDDDGSDDDGEDETDQEETEMPRLKIFGKMRGPKGWRKRAEAEELLERNVFALKVGLLDPDADKPGAQERNVVAHLEFVESDATRDHGILKLRLPDDVTLDDFTQTKAGIITVKIPYGEA